jgi:hypothetical protein
VIVIVTVNSRRRDRAQCSPTHNIEAYSEAVIDFSLMLVMVVMVGLKLHVRRRPRALAVATHSRLPQINSTTISSYHKLEVAFASLPIVQLDVLVLDEDGDGLWLARPV